MHAPRLALAALALGGALAASTLGVRADWPTYHLNNGRTADATSDTAISTPPAPAWSTPLDGLIYAEPLVFGNQVIVATENDTVYSLDLHSGQVNWSRSVAGPGRSPVPGSQLPCGDIDPIGVTGTPVIDPATGKVFVVAESWDGTNQSSDHHLFWALDLNNGGNPTVSAVNVDPASAAFNPRTQQHRAALALNGGHVYMTYGGRSGDCEPYHGWVARIEENGSGFITANVDASGGRGGIWAPSGPAIDGAGNLYVTTGNGNQTNNNATSDLTDSVIKLSPALAVLDHFTPNNWGAENSTDSDLGSAGPMLLSNGLIYQVGKSGTAYLLNTASLGAGNDKGGQAWSGSVCRGFGGSAYDPGNDIVYSTCTDGVRALKVHRPGGTNCSASVPPCLEEIWHGPSAATAPPILVGPTVWVRGAAFGSSNTALYGLDAAGGTPVATLTGIDGTAHFVTPAAAGGVLLVASGTSMRAWSGPTSSWFSLGNTGKGRVAVGRNADGRLEAFMRGTDDKLWHIWQLAAGGGWSGWASLGGVLAGDPSVASNPDGRLEVFAVASDAQLYHQAQVAPNGGWGGWAALGGNLAGRPAVGSNADGRLEVFTRGADGTTWHTWQRAPGGGWSAQFSLGGNTATDPAAARSADGRLELFVRGTDNTLWTLWQLAAGGGWGSWTSLGGTLASAPAVANNPDGRMEVFSRSADNAIWHTWQLVPNGGWSSHVSLGGNFTSEPSVGRNADGRLAVFAVRGSGMTSRNEQVAANGGWGAWTDMPALNAGAPPGVGSNADGRLEVFSPATNGVIWHAWQRSPNSW